ncbi:MAG: penicillin-binding protein 2 [candidate division WS6 bacterium OLB21]|uniref:beta-lactamase n=1 Tax=candidate division WS6 bacterium OLB21 TaxID=1617427 RepID=A0A136KJR1_9BACT|nr:MAG: penicillin-binding protein 2 [candidate division WS6 bacterium OLB21]
MRLKNNPKRNRIDFVNLQTGKNAFQGISFSWRYLPVYLLMVFVFGFLFLNLFNLQIIEGSQNLKVATRINRSTNMIIPPRGIIYDSNGTKLAYNLPSYSLYVNPSQISETDELPVLENLSAYLEIGEDDIINRYQSAVYDENGNKRKNKSS